MTHQLLLPPPSQPDALIERLITLREENDTLEISSHDALRRHLQNAYELALALYADKDKQKKFREQLVPKAFFPSKERSVRAVVGYVFGNRDRRRISDYRITLLHAVERGVQGQNLAHWLEDNGGYKAVVDRVRANKREASGSSTSTSVSAVETTELTLNLSKDHDLQDGVYAALVTVSGSKLTLQKRTKNAAAMRALNLTLSRLTKISSKPDDIEEAA